MRISLVVSCVLAASLFACAQEQVETDAPRRGDDVAADERDTDRPKAASPDRASTNKSTPVRETEAPSTVPQATKESAAPAIVAPAAKIPLLPMNMSFHGQTGDWLMSRDANEGAANGYHFTGIQYRVFEAPPSDVAVKTLYRCIDANGTHYQSNDFACEGAGTVESLLGYVYIDDPGNGAKEISRCIGASGSPIVSTTRLADCDPFIVQGISLGYAFDASVTVAP